MLCREIIAVYSETWKQTTQKFCVGEMQNNFMKPNVHRGTVSPYFIKGLQKFNPLTPELNPSEQRSLTAI